MNLCCSFAGHGVWPLTHRKWYLQVSYINNINILIYIYIWLFYWLINQKNVRKRFASLFRFWMPSQFACKYSYIFWAYSLISDVVYLIFTVNCVYCINKHFDDTLWLQIYIEGCRGWMWERSSVRWWVKLLEDNT